MKRSTYNFYIFSSRFCIQCCKNMEREELKQCPSMKHFNVMSIRHIWGSEKTVIQGAAVVGDVSLCLYSTCLHVYVVYIFISFFLKLLSYVYCFCFVFLWFCVQVRYDSLLFYTSMLISHVSVVKSISVRLYDLTCDIMTQAFSLVSTFAQQPVAQETNSDKYENLTISFSFLLQMTIGQREKIGHRGLKFSFYCQKTFKKNTHFLLLRAGRKAVGHLSWVHWWEEQPHNNKYCLLLHWPSFYSAIIFLCLLLSALLSHFFPLPPVLIIYL